MPADGHESSSRTAVGGPGARRLVSASGRLRWHCGQMCVERPAIWRRTIFAPQRLQGKPSRP